MTEKEVQRYHVLRQVLDEELSLGEAAEAMGVSYRQAQRLKEQVVSEGPKGLVHGNRGRRAHNRLADELRQRVLALAEDRYAGFNDTHLSEVLGSEEGIRIGRETLRGWLRGAGVKPKRKRRAQRHRRRRERRAQEGMMMLWDGSPHRWFGDQVAPCCLMAAVDDATGALLAARFMKAECSLGYLELLWEVVTSYGIPAAVYQDAHSALRRNDGHWTLEEQLAGRQEPTQVGAALEALGITPITAQSPQAKGRVERCFGVLQDRLMAELRLNGITDIEGANAFVSDGYLERHNRRFAQAARESRRAWRKPSRNLDLERLISFRYQATVAQDNTVKLGGITMDIPPGPAGRSYARAKVEVRQLLDGSWRIYYQDYLIATHPRTDLKEPIRALKRRRKGVRAARETVWVYLQSAPSGSGVIVFDE
jgi:transposase